MCFYAAQAANSTEVHFMKKAKQVLSLVLAAIMVMGIGIPTAFAKTRDNNYEVANMYPESYSDGVSKYRFTAEQGAGYVLDLLDNLLYEAALDLSKEPVFNQYSVKVYLEADLTSIDTAMYFLYNLLYAIQHDSDYIRNVADITVLGGLGVTGLAGKIVTGMDLGDIKSLNGDDLAVNGNIVYRNVNYSGDKVAQTDMHVLMALIKFLDRNKNTLAKITNGSIGFGTLDGAIKGIKNVGPILQDLPSFLKKLLYQKLVNSDFDTDGALPSGVTVDSDLQNIVNWALVTGTGTEAADGGKSVLGENFEAFLPDIGNYPGGASLGAEAITVDRNGDGQPDAGAKMNFYQLVNNAINALLSGFVSDKLEDLLIDLLDIDPSINDGKGDTAIMQDMIFTAITGAIEGLCVANGAPAITYNSDEETYPIPKIEKLLHWFFVEGGLSTFVKISYSGIQLTDNFMSLLNDIARALPGLFPLFGFEVPEGLTYTNEEMNEKWVDKTGDDIYLTYYGQKVQGTVEEEAEQLYKHVNETTGNVYYTFKSNGAVANTTDDGQSDYINPDFIRPKYVLSNQNIYAALVKILLNHFVDGCYFNKDADTIPMVGAYALASLAAQYIPENNYFDRLDAAMAQLQGEPYIPKVGQNVTPLPFTETITIPSVNGQNSKEVTIPRAAMDIGASLGAYFLSGWQDFEQGLGFKLETDTSFEVFAMEFLTWAVATYMPIFAGKWDPGSMQFVNNDDGSAGTWKNTFNSALTTFRTALNNHPSTGTAINRISNIPTSEIRNALYTLLNNTLFVLIPYNWLPDWVADYGASGLVNEWLGQSLCTLDLQRIVSLFGVNTTGELNNSVTKVVINLVDRVLGTVFGGNPLLPPVSNRTVYSASTTLTNLESLIGTTQSTPLYDLLIKLLTYLKSYGQTLCSVIFPLLLSGAVKSYKYYNTTAPGAQQINYIGNNQIELEDLQTYLDINNAEADMNAAAFSGPVYFNSDAKAADVASKIGVSFNAETDHETIGGSVKYKVVFPAEYGRMSQAEAAAAYVENSYAKRLTENGNRVFKLYVKDNYRTGTATETTTDIEVVDGVVKERQYNYTGIHSITANKSGNDYQTGSKGEVVFPAGYRTSAREDFRAFQVFYTNRYFNAVEDAEEFIGEFNTYAHSTLSDAYGAWLMYFVKMQLRAAGQLSDNVATPGEKTPYPFYITGNESSAESYIGPQVANYNADTVWNTRTTKSYPFANNNAYKVVAEALAYADATEEDGTTHDVTMGVGDTEAIVRLALGNNTFTITGKDEAGIAAAWAALSTANRSAINTLCNGLGITFDSENNKITRKSFKLFGASLNGKNAFGNWYDDSNSGTPISLKPISSYTPGAENADEVKNEIQKAYIEFAKTAREYNDRLNDYYDNLSWRIANREAALEGNETDITSLQWVLAYTQESWKSSVTNKRNQKKNSFGTWTTAYTAKTYDEFQRAYEYGQALITARSNGAHILQSLITEAYKAILKAYYNLKDFDAKPDWTTLYQLIEMARAIINGPLGIGPEVDRDVGYTTETLNNLVAALQVAETFYNNNQGQDVEFQDNIDEEATILNAVIGALDFPEGITPGAIKDPSPDNDSNLDILGAIGNTDCIWTKTGDNRSYRVILGMEEGVNFTDSEGTMPMYGDNNKVFVSSGFTENGRSNDFNAVKGQYGGGTGSYLVGRVNYAEAFRYYAVLIGDVNGDARIDSADKTIINMIVTNQSEAELEPYIGVAADVNRDGHVTADDAAIIGQKVNHIAGVEISQAATADTATWFN